MTLPHPALVPLILGRDIETFDAAAAVRSAVEHRVDGLLWSRHLGSGWCPAGVAEDLARRDLVRRSQQGRLWRSLDAVAGRLDAMGVRWMLLKGLGVQQRFYDRPGERPTGDLDVLVSPVDAHRIGAIVRSLQPDHALADVAQRIVDDGDEQALEVVVDGAVVDLHVDMLKTRLPMRSVDALWSTAQAVTSPSGRPIVVPSAEMALLHHVVHLNKDRFRFLLGYVDVARIAPHVDVEVFWRYVRDEGLRTHVALALQAIDEVLPVAGLGHEAHLREGWRAATWRRAWPHTVRLSGEEGISRYRHRQDLLSLTAQGRTGEFLRTRTRQRLFPPAERVDQVYPGLRGPYLWRLTAGRVRAAVGRRASRRGA